MSSVPLRIQLQFLSLCSYLDFLPWLPSGDRLSSGCVWWNKPFPLQFASGDGVFNSNSKNQAGCAWTAADMSAKLCGAPLGWLESLCHPCCIISVLNELIELGLLGYLGNLRTQLCYHNAEVHWQTSFWHSLGVFVLTLCKLTSSKALFRYEISLVFF